MARLIKRCAVRLRALWWWLLDFRREFVAEWQRPDGTYCAPLPTHLLGAPPKLHMCPRCGRPFLIRTGHKLFFVQLTGGRCLVFCRRCWPQSAAPRQQARNVAAALRCQHAADN